VSIGPAGKEALKHEKAVSGRQGGCGSGRSRTTGPPGGLFFLFASLPVFVFVRVPRRGQPKPPPGDRPTASRVQGQASIDAHQGPRRGRSRHARRRAISGPETWAERPLTRRRPGSGEDTAFRSRPSGQSARPVASVTTPRSPGRKAVAGAIGKKSCRSHSNRITNARDEINGAAASPQPPAQTRAWCWGKGSIDPG